MKKDSGNANRTQELDARQKAVLESEKRIAQSTADIKKNIELASANELMAIGITAASDIEKAKAEIYSKENLSKLQKDKEFAAKKAEIEQKAAVDSAKIRTALNVKIATEEMAQSEQYYKDVAAQEDKVNAARVAAQSQTRTLGQQTQELQARFALQQSIIGLSTIDQDRQTKIFDAIQQQRAALETLNAIKDLPNDDRLQREQDINAEYAKRIGLINAETDAKLARENDFSAGIKESMKRYQESITPLKQGQQVADSVFQNMESALDKFVTTGKFSFQDFASSVVQDLIKIQLRASATQLFNSVLGMFGFALPGKAIGGPVSPGKPYMVGERGPELFMPSSAGTIVPNNKLGGSSSGSIGGGTTIINNISAIDSRSVQQLFAEHRMTLFGNVEQARRELPMRTR